MKKRKIVIGLLVLIVGSILFLLGPSMNRLISKHPNIQNQWVFGLPFKGSKSSSLDGTLRLFLQKTETGITDHKQTTLPYRKVSIDWLSQTTPPCFIVYIDRKPMMVWQIDRDVLRCVAGDDFLTADPYDRVETNVCETNRAEQGGGEERR